MEIISKELLSEVLEEEILRIGSYNYPIIEGEVKRYSIMNGLDIIFTN